jgi:hypothetical protein
MNRGRSGLAAGRTGDSALYCSEVIPLWLLAGRCAMEGGNMGRRPAMESLLAY